MKPVVYQKRSKFSLAKDALSRNYTKLGAVATVAVLSTGAHAADGGFDVSAFTSGISDATSNAKIVFAASLVFLGMMIGYKKLKRAANSA